VTMSRISPTTGRLPSYKQLNSRSNKIMKTV